MNSYSILLLLISTLYCITLEEFTYHTKIRNLRVGNTIIEILKEEDNQTILKINSSTNKFDSNERNKLIFVLRTLD